MTPQSYYRCWVEVDLDALRHNIAAIRQHIGPGKKIMAVVKADAYGHGLAQVAGVLMQCGVDAFAVANLNEALLLRQIGGPGWPILLLGSALPFELEKLLEQNITPTLSTLDEARALNAAAGNRRVRVHVEIDTGMGRVGFWHDEAGAAIREIAALPNLQIEALYTHFPSADENIHETRRQLATFLNVAKPPHLNPLPQAERKPAALPSPPGGEGQGEGARALLHAANSAALLNLPESHLDMVRPGLLLYGIVPAAGSPAGLPALQIVGRESPLGFAPWRADFQPVLSFKARVIYVKDIVAGRSISYGQTFVAERPMRVATIAAGYADGFSRSLSNNAQVLIAGQRCRVVGRVTMDQIMVEVTALANVQCGDEVVFIGRQGSQEISATEVAGWENTIAWEVLCGITKTTRVPRIYRGASAA